MVSKKYLAGLFALLALTLAGCASTPTPDQGTPSASGGTKMRALISSAEKPAATSFKDADLQGIGTVQMPTGGDWTEKDGKYRNEKIDMTILTQDQPGDLTEQTRDYMDSYIEVNKRDAPKFEVVTTEEGALNIENGQPAQGARIDGKFDNGTDYTTRDYLFFTPAKVVILMGRVDAKNAAQLAPMMDYIASTLKAK